jgi:hypothetical protein
LDRPKRIAFQSGCVHFPDHRCAKRDGADAVTQWAAAKLPVIDVQTRLLSSVRHGDPRGLTAVNDTQQKIFQFGTCALAISGAGEMTLALLEPIPPKRPFNRLATEWKITRWKNKKLLSSLPRPNCQCNSARTRSPAGRPFHIRDRQRIASWSDPTHSGFPQAAIGGIMGHARPHP